VLAIHRPVVTFVCLDVGFEKLGGLQDNAGIGKALDLVSDD
jgi:hypothetical protein